MSATSYLESFVEPFGTLWFIYLLPVFFVVTKLTRRVPPLAIWIAAAALEMMHVATGWTVIDEFCSRFVYFYSGYWFAASVFALSDRARARPALAHRGTGAVGDRQRRAGRVRLSANGRLCRWRLGSQVPARSSSWARCWRGCSWLNFLRYCGEHSIVIYLAFFLPMAVTRTLLLKTGVISDIGTVSLIVTIAGIAGAVLIWRARWRVGARFLFERPDAFWIAPRKTGTRLQAAE